VSGGGSKGLVLLGLQLTEDGPMSKATSNLPDAEEMTGAHGYSVAVLKVLIFDDSLLRQKTKRPC
jgi:hypothetical protein